MELALCVYRLTQSFPVEERFGMTAQIRRSAVSIPSNIAEGKGRESDGEFARFLRIARGSLSELQTQLLLSKDLGFAEMEAVEKAMSIAEEVGRMLRGMQKTLD